MSITSKIYRLNKLLLKKAAETVESLFDISFMEYEVLKATDTDRKVRQVDIAAQVGVTTAAVTKLIAKLDEKGLLVTEVNPNNHREKIVKLTQTGKEVFQRAELKLNQLFSDNVNTTAVDQLKKLESSLTNLINRLESK